MSAFRKLAAKYASLGVVVGETAKAVATDVKAELESGFSQGKDAYGNAWPALATGNASHLYETGKYRGSLDVLAVPGVGQSLVEMTSGNAANLHARDVRNGRRFQPARPLMPISGQQLPTKWQEIIAKNYADSMRDATK